MVFELFTNKGLPWLGRVFPSNIKSTLSSLGLVKAYLFLFYQKRKLVDKLIFRRSIINKYFDSHDKRLLNFGAGGDPTLYIENFLNCDIKHGVYVDVTEKLPFDSDSVDVIFHEHLFEHIDFPNECSFFLNEKFRILKPGGILRFGMPDFEGYVQAYLTDSFHKLPKLRSVYPKSSEETRPMELLNHLFRQYGEHKFIYDFRSIKYLLESVGFVAVTKREKNVSSIPNWSSDRYKYDDTMYIECVRP